MKKSMNRVAQGECLAAWVGCLVLLVGGRPVRAEAQAAKDKTVIQAALDVSPLVDEVRNLANLIKISFALTEKQGTVGQAQAQGLQGILESMKRFEERMVVLEQSMQKIEVEVRKPRGYEYNILRAASESKANELGATGWRLIAVLRDEWLIFEKPIYHAGAVPAPAPEGPEKGEKGEKEKGKD